MEHVHDVSFQHVSTFQELVPQLHYEETSLLAFSMQQIRTDDITSIRQALFDKGYLLVVMGGGITGTMQVSSK